MSCATIAGKQLAPPVSSPHFFSGCGPVALFNRRTSLDHCFQSAEWGVTVWNERKMPERWYELLRRRMQVIEERMRLTKGGYIIERDQLQKLLMEADSLDREMLLVMTQTVAEAPALEELGTLRAQANDFAFIPGPSLDW